MVQGSRSLYSADCRVNRPSTSATVLCTVPSRYETCAPVAEALLNGWPILRPFDPPRLSLPAESVPTPADAAPLHPRVFQRGSPVHRDCPTELRTGPSHLPAYPRSDTGLTRPTAFCPPALRLLYVVLPLCAPSSLLRRLVCVATRGALGGMAHSDTHTHTHTPPAHPSPHIQASRNVRR